MITIIRKKKFTFAVWRPKLSLTFSANLPFAIFFRMSLATWHHTTMHLERMQGLGSGGWRCAHIAHVLHSPGLLQPSGQSVTLAASDGNACQVCSAIPQVGTRMKAPSSITSRSVMRTREGLFYGESDFARVVIKSSFLNKLKNTNPLRKAILYH